MRVHVYPFRAVIFLTQMFNHGCREKRRGNDPWALGPWTLGRERFPHHVVLKTQTWLK